MTTSLVLKIICNIQLFGGFLKTFLTSSQYYAKFGGLNLGPVNVAAAPLTATCSFVKLSCNFIFDWMDMSNSWSKPVPTQTLATLQLIGFARTDGERFGVNVVLLVKHWGCIVCTMKSDSGSIERHNNFTSSFRYAGRSIADHLQAYALWQLFYFSYLIGCSVRD